ncbi:MAG: electron transporter SenC [Bacteroidia bacterium]|nr:MAG: electron transporter SenC [Bacteroidia bacterium]
MKTMTLVLGVLLGTSVAQGQVTPDKIVEEVRIDQKMNTKLPLDLRFRNERGESIALREYFGKRPVILAFVYYECPMLCTQILNGMVATLKTLKFTAGREFEVLTVSIDPRETPELASGKKEQYLLTYGRDGAEAGWHFLTGEKESIEALTDAAGFHYVYDEKTDFYAHAAAIMVVTPEGTLARYFFGIEYPARDLTFAVMEASQERIGSAVDQLLLLCYQYDPAAGKYSLLVSTVLKISAVITVVTLGGFMVVMLRRERKARRRNEAGEDA